MGEQVVRKVAFPKLIDQRKNKNVESDKFILPQSNHHSFIDNSFHQYHINNSLLVFNIQDNTRNKAQELNGGNKNISNYEMDSFPKRNITKKLKNA